MKFPHCMVESHKNENSKNYQLLAIFEVETSAKSISHKILFFSSCKICTLENCIENFTMVQIQSLVKNLKLKKVNGFTEISKKIQKFNQKFHFFFPDPRNNEIETNHGDRVKRSNNKKPSPPPSQFQHLGPSKNRYTLLHDEF